MHSLSPLPRVTIIVLVLAMLWAARTHGQSTVGVQLSHLAAGAGLLNDLPKVPPPDKNKVEKKIGELRNHLTAIQKAYNEKGDWQHPLTDAENDIVALIGGGSQAVGIPGLGAPTLPPSALAKEDAPVSTGLDYDLGIKSLDPALRSRIEQVRVELELFMASTMMEIH